MDYQLPTEFDLIVIGTGVVESIVSAAASRIGKNVLHIDSNYYYGGLWASFNLEQIEKLCEFSKNVNTNTSQDIELSKDHIIIPIGNDIFNFKDTSQQWIILENEDHEEKIKVNIEDTDKSSITEANDSTSKTDKLCIQKEILKDSRKFNIDIAPKLQFARGNLVELLISSNIARYSEYRSVSRVLTWLNNELEVVPCSRFDVFSNTKVSIIEKRMLMKLLEGCMDSGKDEFKNYENKTFLSYLKDKKLTDNIIHYVLYAIAMCNDNTLCLEGVENVKRFLNSLGRFGKTPFLYSMYGSGELSQAFCRLSAVFGGVYALNQNLSGLILDAEKKYKGLICGKQVINSQYLVMSVENSPLEFVKSIKPLYISRGIFITNRSIMESEKEHLTLLLYPLKNGKRSCNIIELGSLTGTCPKGYYIVHMFTEQEKNPKEDLEDCVSKLFRNEEDNDVLNKRPQILWSFYYSAPDVNFADLRENSPENVFLCPGPDSDLDMDLSIKKARDIFLNMYPDLEFLPRAPDADEIIIEDSISENVQISNTNPNEHETYTDAEIENTKKSEDTEKANE